MTSKLGVLGNVLPCFAVDYEINGDSRHVEKASQLNALFASGNTFSDFSYLRFIQLCLVVLRTLHTRWINCALFVVHVLNIILLGSKKQVRWIAARRSIARMANIHAWWNGNIMQLVTKAMGVDANAPNRDRAISCLGQLSRPQPTTVGAILIDALPETFLGRAICRYVMGNNEGHRLSFEPTAIRPRHFCNIGLLTTTALTVTVGYFLSVHMSILAQAS